MFPTQQFLDGSLYRDRADRANVQHVHLGPEREAEIPLALYWEREDVPRFIPTDTATGVSAFAEVQQGAWIVKCPLCGFGAQYASRTDHRFLCLACLNETAGGLWLHVVWPDDVPDGELVLRARPTPNANWVRGESVSDLVAENAAHGLGV